MLEVWDVLFEPLDLYRRCSLQYVGHMGGLYCAGMAMTEIESGCRLYGVAPTPLLIDDVLTLAQAAAEYLNQPKETPRGGA